MSLPALARTCGRPRPARQSTHPSECVGFPDVAVVASVPSRRPRHLHELLPQRGRVGEQRQPRSTRPTDKRPTSPAEPTCSVTPYKRRRHECVCRGSAMLSPRDGLLVHSTARDGKVVSIRTVGVGHWRCPFSLTGPAPPSGAVDRSIERWTLDGQVEGPADIFDASPLHVCRDSVMLSTRPGFLSRADRAGTTCKPGPAGRSWASQLSFSVTASSCRRSEIPPAPSDRRGDGQVAGPVDTRETSRRPKGHLRCLPIMSSPVDRPVRRGARAKPILSCPCYG